MANYINDVKQGCWIIFDDAGNISYEMYYHNGEKVGACYIWHENAKLISEKKSKTRIIFI